MYLFLSVYTIIITTRLFLHLILLYIKINMVINWVHIIVMNHFLLFFITIRVLFLLKLLICFHWGYILLDINFSVGFDSFPCKIIHFIDIYKKYNGNHVYTPVSLYVIYHMYLFFVIYHFQIFFNHCCWNVSFCNHCIDSLYCVGGNN